MAKIADLYADIRGDVSNLKAALGNANTMIGDFGKKAEGVGKSGSLDFMDVAKAVAVTTAAIVAAKKAFDFAKEGAQIASLQNASYKLAASYGANMPQIVRAVKEASFNTISEYEAMKSANLAMTMGVSADAEQIGNLLQIAMMRARAFGLTTEEAFNRITIGIGRRSIKVLDDLGFNIVGATSVQDLFNKVLEQGNKELADMGGLAADISTPYQRLSTVYKDISNQVKMAAGYGMLPFLAGRKEVQQIQEERAAVASSVGDYKEYEKGLYGAAAAQGAFIDLQGRLVKYFDRSGRQITTYEGLAREGLAATKEVIDANYLLSEAEHARFSGMAAMSNHYREMNGLTAEATSTNKLFTEQLALQVALSGDLSGIFDNYNAGIKDAGENESQLVAVTDMATQSLKDYAFQLMTANLDMEQHGELTLSMGLSLGQLTEQEYEAARAGAAINKWIKENNVSWKEAQPVVDAFSRGLDGMMTGGEAHYFVYVHYITTGGSAAGLGFTSEGIRDEMKLLKGNMHGGTVYGGQHGMVVPPGFSNDGMPVMVSSGERLDVTPAGNKNGGESELIGMIADLKYTMDGLPRIIRDAVKMA